jgi:hypothetical protein
MVERTQPGETSAEAELIRGALDYTMIGWVR